MQDQLEKVSHKIARWVGSPISIVVHTIAFIAIFLTYFAGASLASILLVLTTLVSLEAIYLSIFVQMTVNKQEKMLDAHKEDLEAHGKHLQDITESLKGENP